jgi:hypothetical protein
MRSKILIVVFIAVILFGIYSWYTTRNSDGFYPETQEYAPAEVHKVLIEVPEDRVVASSGPNPPNQESRALPQIMPEETPFDPQDKGYESAEIPERLRHPERMFSPGMVNDEIQDSIASGVASNAQQVTNNAYQTFGPEFATNGASFLDNGVMANDIDVPKQYSII